MGAAPAAASDATETEMTAARLADRAVVGVAGEEARIFLDRLVTCDVDKVAPGQARYGALLSPQGKILADFILVQTDDEGRTFLLDCPAVCAADLVRRLTLYKLRAKLTIADLSASHAVLVGWGETAMPAGGFVDPRLPALGWRAIVSEPATVPSAGDEAAYHAHRVSLGIPDSTRDFALGDAFPHEALMDQLAGVDFTKGCYVGQEVVSRMQHRGTARTRIVSVALDASAQPGEGEIVAGERAIGRLGSVAGERGLAMLRVDRAADALAAGEPIRAGEAVLHFDKPSWVRFPYPGEELVPAA
jgi:folate-binding protein YgfZ